MSLELLVRIGVGVGTAADQVGAVAKGCDQQFLGAGIVGQAFLREGADDEVQRPGIIALQRLDRLETAQADARIDFDMRAHPRGAVDHRALDHPLAALVDVLDGEFALHRGDRLDGLAEAAMAMAATAEQAGLVEMDVGVDKARQHQPAGDIDLRRLADKFWRNRGDPAGGNPDIDRCRGAARHGIAEDEVEGGFGLHWNGWLAVGEV